MADALRTETAKASLGIVEKQFNAGQVNRPAVLNAQQTYLTAIVVRVQTGTDRLVNTRFLSRSAAAGRPRIRRECAIGGLLNRPIASGGPRI